MDSFDQFPLFRISFADMPQDFAFEDDADRIECALNWFVFTPARFSSVFSHLANVGWLAYVIVWSVVAQ